MLPTNAEGEQRALTMPSWYPKRQAQHRLCMLKMKKKYYVPYNIPDICHVLEETNSSSMLWACAICPDQPNNVPGHKRLRHKATHTTADCLLKCRVGDIGANS